MYKCFLTLECSIERADRICVFFQNVFGEQADVHYIVFTLGGDDTCPVGIDFYAKYLT